MLRTMPTALLFMVIAASADANDDVQSVALRIQGTGSWTATH